MQTTGNLGLKKPEGTDVVDIADLNGNADILDTAVSNKVDKVAGKQLSTEDYTTAEKTKLAGVAAGANAYVHPANHPASVITQDASNRFVTDAEKTAWNAKASTAVATTSAAGLQSAADKVKLDGIAAGANNYTHPVNHPPSVITQDASNRFVTDAEKIVWNAKASTVSPTFTGTPLAPTAVPGANTQQIATTAFVQATKDPIITSGTDINSLTESGNYFVSSPVNGPSAINSIYLQVLKHSNNFVAQTAYLSGFNQTFTRRKEQGNWTYWKQLSNETIINVYDANLMLDNGNYYTYTNVNMPTTHIGWTVNVVNVGDAGHIRQTAYALGSTITYTRIKTPSGWGAWTETHTSDSKPYVTGSYTGDGAAIRDIALPFTPTAIQIVETQSGFGTYQGRSGMSLNGIPSISWDGKPYITIGLNKVTVYYNGSTREATNQNIVPYCYIAFK